MKKKLFSALLLSGLMLCSCNNEDVIDQHEDIGAQKNAYLSLTVNLPQGTTTRSQANTPNPGEAGDGNESGSTIENEVKEVLVFGFGTSGTSAKFKHIVTNNDLEKSHGVSSQYLTKEPFKVAAGTYNIYVIANPSFNMKDLQIERIEEKDFIKKEFNYGKELDFKNSKAFPMSTAEKIQETVINASNTKQNPAKFSVKVQRMMAKISLVGFANDIKITDFAQEKANSFATEFKFTRYAIVNKRNSAYWFRQVGDSFDSNEIGVAETGTNYVIDPIFYLKSATYSKHTANDHYYDNETNSLNEKYWKKFSKSKDPFVEYCYENTMKSEAQIQGYSTGLLLEAQFTPKTFENSPSYTNGNTFYMYDGKYYASKSDLDKVCLTTKSFENIDDNTYDNDESSRITLMEKYNQQGVKIFYKGKCYYNFWIRHANNGDAAKMGVMEFAIVRNNVYKMTVNSIKGPGSSIPPVNPDQPDEDGNTYLDVTVDVLPWIVRNNNMDL